ncbi:MAG: hypothetical protein HYS04_19445 [Acidobacteria bacterium]|nr:hypothetical protein [Acidobacteriota bacterium]
MSVSAAAFIRLIRGPIVLIALGTLFAIDHEGGPTFDRTWPTLIILIGLFKLLEFAMARNQPAPPGYVPPGGGSVPPAGGMR